VAAMNLVRLRARRAGDRRTSFPWLIAAVGAAGVLQDSWPGMLPWPALNLHAVYGVLLLGMVLLQTRRTGLADAMIDAADKCALRRQLSRAVYLQLYLVFGMSLLVHIAALLWNSSLLGALHPARLPPPENLRDYLAYGVFALFAILVLPSRSPKRAVAS
jgi:cytochrome b561